MEFVTRIRRNPLKSLIAFFAIALLVALVIVIFFGGSPNMQARDNQMSLSGPKPTPSASPTHSKSLSASSSSTCLVVTVAS